MRTEGGKSALVNRKMGRRGRAVEAALVGAGRRKAQGRRGVAGDTCCGGLSVEDSGRSGDAGDTGGGGLVVQSEGELRACGWPPASEDAEVEP